MAEYPPRSCGPCKYLGKFDTVAKQQGGDYLHEGTVPKPELLVQKRVTLNEHALGVPASYEHPDLRVPPVPTSIDGCCCQPPPSAQNKEEPCPDTKYSLKEALWGRLDPKVGKVCPENNPGGVQPPPVGVVRVDVSQLADQTQEALDQQIQLQQQQFQQQLNYQQAQQQQQNYQQLQPSGSKYNFQQTPSKFNVQTQQINPPHHNVQQPQDQHQMQFNQAQYEQPPQVQHFNPQGLGSHQMEFHTRNVAEKPLKGILKNPRETQVPCPCEEKMIKADECTPLDQDPFAKPPVPNELRPVDEQIGRPPCYLPQPEDNLLSKNEAQKSAAWATGRLDWGPLAGLTGTRPVVDKYSITRFSEGEWRQHNKETLEKPLDELHRANLIEFNARQCLEQTRAETDKNQHDSTRRLKLREQEVFRWKCELERAIDAAAEEIAFMERERRRLKQASAVLMLPEAIAGECLERRTGRFDPELVRDDVEEELIKEMALTAEIRLTFEKTLKDVEMQLLENKTAKQRLEYDWSDKKQAHEMEVINVALNNKSNVLLFKPGSVRFPENQSSPEHWEQFTRETLQESEATRQRSVALRGTLEAILINAARDLRAQADRVEAALSKRIACTDEIRIQLENELRKILQRIADIEVIIDDLREAIRRMDIPMKKAHTRLANRNNRPRVENCRDVAQFGLVEEVKNIAESVAALRSQLTQAQDSQAQLMKSRNDLEREIMVKRKTLEIDRDRAQMVRTHYPSANALTGFV